MSVKNTGPKTLLIDIETSPIIGAVWRPWKTDLLWIEEDWKMLMVCYKWLGDKKTHTLTGRCLTEGEIAEDINNLFDEADIVVGHNGDKFDIKKIQAKVLEFGHPIPSPFKSVDTLKAARNHFGFTSNRLDDLCQKLGLGEKLDTGGKELWKRVREGDEKAWKHMEKYCRRDVDLLEKLYLTLRPWMPRHPNMAVYAENHVPTCAHCGSTKVTLWDTAYYTNSSKYMKFQCECGGWSRMRRADGKLCPSRTPATIVCDRR